MNYIIVLLLAWSFFLQSLSFLNRRSQRQQTSADRQSTEVYFEYCLSRWMHIIRRITAVKTYHLKRCSVSLGVLCGLNFVPFVSAACPERSRTGGQNPEKVTKMSLLQNEPKTNPNEPNFPDTQPRSKPKNEDFRQIYDNLFMQNEPNGMLFKPKTSPPQP